MLQKIASTTGTASRLSAADLRGIGTVLGIGSLIALLRVVSRRNLDDVNTDAAALRRGEAEVAALERERALALETSRRHTTDAMRMSLARRGVGAAVHPGHDPFAPAFIAEAARPGHDLARRKSIGVVEF